MKIEAIAPLRAERLVRDACPGLSRRDAQLLFEHKGVRDAAGRAVAKGDLTVPGATYHVDLAALDERSAAEREQLASQERQVAWLGEGPRWVALLKPAPLGSLPRHYGDLLCFSEYARRLIVERRQIDVGALPECGMVHRLDNATSGVMLVALDGAAQDAFIAARGTTLRRTYWAIVDGKIADRGTVEAPIANRGDRVVLVTDGGQPAKTHYEVLARAGEKSLVQASIEGGRRHQIRVHLAALGAPILGDPLYSPRGAERLALHAVMLSFARPDSGEVERIRAEPDPGFWALGLDLEHMAPHSQK